MIVLVGLVLVGLLFSSAALRAQTSNCTVTILNRSVQFGPGRSFAIPNLPYQPGYFRVRVACSDDGQSSGGQSAFFQALVNGSVVMPSIPIGPLSALPVSLVVTSPKTNLATRGETAQLVATASYADGSSADVTFPDQGTSWSSSNPSPSLG